MKECWINLFQKNLVVVLKAPIIEGVSGVIITIEIILPIILQELLWTVPQDYNLGFPDRTNKTSNYNNKINNISNTTHNNLNNINNNSNNNILPFNLDTTIGKKISSDSVYSQYISLYTI